MNPGPQDQWVARNDAYWPAIASPGNISPAGIELT